MHFRMQDEECLNSSNKSRVEHHVYFLEYSLANLNSERNLEEQLKNEKNPCNDLDGASHDFLV